MVWYNCVLSCKRNHHWRAIDEVRKSGARTITMTAKWNVQLLVWKKLVIDGTIRAQLNFCEKERIWINELKVPPSSRLKMMSQMFVKQMKEEKFGFGRVMISFDAKHFFKNTFPILCLNSIFEKKWKMHCRVDNVRDYRGLEKGNLYQMKTEYHKLVCD